MTDKVDVDGLIASAQRVLRKEGYGEGLCEDLAVARAALAELIEVAQRIRNDCAFNLAHTDQETGETYIWQLNAALARVSP